MEKIIYDIAAWAIVIAFSTIATWLLGSLGIFDAIEKLYL